MSFSLNEIAVTAKKAARGAGYPWGLAEEAAQATRFLCANGLPGCETLADLLAANLAPDLPRHSPGGPGWDAPGPLCPLITGAALSDSADRLRSAPIHIETVAFPLLLLPFAAMASRQIAQSLSVSTGATTATTDGQFLTLTGEPFPASANLTIRPGPAPAPHALHTRADPDPQAWAALTAYARRTYAPATDASRLLGAGAGLSDND